MALPSGRGDSFEFVSGVFVNPRQRSITEDNAIRALLINGSKLRVGSAADEKIGLDVSEIENVEKAFRSDPKNKTKNIPQ